MNASPTLNRTSVGVCRSEGSSSVSVMGSDLLGHGIGSQRSKSESFVTEPRSVEWSGLVWSRLWSQSKPGFMIVDAFVSAKHKTRIVQSLSNQISMLSLSLSRTQTHIVRGIRFSQSSVSKMTQLVRK